MYKEIKPNKAIQTYIHSYWIINAKDVVSGEKHKVLPDGCFDIVIDITPQSNHIVLTGIWDESVVVKINKNQLTLGTRFYPSAINIFFNCKVSAYRNTVTQFKKDMLKEIHDISLDLLFESKDKNEIIEFLDLYFVLLANKYDGKQSVFYKLKEEIEDKNVAQFAEGINISTRQLRRLYKDNFGITTKTYCNILRFIKAKEMLLFKEDYSLLHISNECNYYDQAHFIKEFKKFSGLTPNEFRQCKKNSLSHFYNTFE